MQLGDEIALSVEILPQLLPSFKSDWTAATFILGGAPLLISQGQLLHDYSVERLRDDFIEQRHARTAVGVRKNGWWVFVVVEKNRLHSQSGLTIPELAALMASLDCYHAVNLDGGSSSAMFVSEQVVNHATVREEEEFSLAITRKVSDVLMVVPRG